VKKYWYLWLGLVISVIMLVLALKGINFHAAIAALAQADYVYLIPAGVALLAYLVTRSVRWRLLLGAKVGLSRCFWVTNIGYLVSNVFPFRLGDPVRAIAIGVGKRVKVSTALSTVFVERVLDMVMVLFILALSLPFVDRVDEKIQNAGVIVGGLVLIVVLGLGVTAARPDWVRWLANRLLMPIVRCVPKLDPAGFLALVDDLLEGLTVLRSIKCLTGALIWSVVTWGFVVGFYWAMLWAFVDHPPLVQGSFLSCVIGLAMAIPAAPGAVGTFHTAAEYALHLAFSIPRDAALMIAFASHTFQYIFSCLLGLIGLAQLGLSLKQLRAQAASLDQVLLEEP
jgi:uncharacterized protein (TIRG00374 family)